jgi:hypothetical protein
VRADHLAVQQQGEALAVDRRSDEACVKPGVRAFLARTSGESLIVASSTFQVFVFGAPGVDKISICGKRFEPLQIVLTP